MMFCILHVHLSNTNSWIQILFYHHLKEFEAKYLTWYMFTMYYKIIWLHTYSSSWRPVETRNTVFLFSLYSSAVKNPRSCPNNSWYTCTTVHYCNRISWYRKLHECINQTHLLRRNVHIGMQTRLDDTMPNKVEWYIKSKLNNHFYTTTLHIVFVCIYYSCIHVYDVGLLHVWEVVCLNYIVW